MIKLGRQRTTGIPLAFRGEDRISKTLQLLQRERDIRKGNLEGHDFPSNWSPAKKQLQVESSNKCAYCESPTTVIAYGDVEHYRPKSKYWWMAYCYDNYLASCQLCNQKYKKAKFDIIGVKLVAPRVRSNSSDSILEAMANGVIPDPLNENEGQSWQDYEDKHEAERPLLLNPYLDDPKDFFGWEVDHVKGTVKLIPIDDSDALHIKMVKAAEKDYGINRKELCSHRYDIYLNYAVARLICEDADVPDMWRNLMKLQKNKSLIPSAAYSGMVLFFDDMKSSDLSLPS